MALQVSQKLLLPVLVITDTIFSLLLCANKDVPCKATTLVTLKGLKVNFFCFGKLQHANLRQPLSQYVLVTFDIYNNKSGNFLYNQLEAESRLTSML